MLLVMARKQTFQVFTDRHVSNLARLGSCKLNHPFGYLLNVQLLRFTPSCTCCQANTRNDAKVDIFEAKIATKNYIAAPDDATALIKISYACTVSMKRSRYASRFIRARQRSTPLRNGIRAMKSREEQVRASSQSLWSVKQSGRLFMRAVAWRKSA